jgi:hypothetical protein
VGRLEARSDGLWACDVTWTEKARPLIEAREARYFSPVLFATAEGLVYELVNLALTNDPALHELEPLAASALSKGEPEMLTGTSGELLSKLAVAAGLPANAPRAEVAARVEELLKLKAKLGSVSTVYGDMQKLRAVARANGFELSGPESFHRVETILTERLATLRAKTAADEAQKLGAQLEAIIADAWERRVIVSKEVESVYRDMAAAPLTETKVEGLRQVLLIATPHPGAAAGKRWEDLSQEERHRLGNDSPEAFRAVHDDYLVRTGRAPAAPVKNTNREDNSPPIVGPKRYEELSTAEKHRMANDQPDVYRGLLTDYKRRTGRE